MLAFPFYLTAIFTQVYNLYGTNSTIEITSAETSIHLQWSVTDLNASYAVMYGQSNNALDINRENVTLPSDTNEDVTHLIEGLDPGQHYNIQLHKDGVLIFQDFIATNPLPVTSLEATVATATSITISWSPSPGSIQNEYQVLVQGVTDASFKFESQNVTDTYYTVPGLHHSQYYRATVVAYSYGEPSNLSTVIDFNTAPLAPVKVEAVAMDTRILNISWAPDPMSTQDSYKIQYLYNASNGNAMEVNKTCDPPTATQCQVEMPGLPGQVYEIFIYSVLGTAVSDSTMTVHSTVPLPITSLEEIASNDTSIHLRWDVPADQDSYFRHFVIHVQSDYGNLNWEVNKDQQDLPITNLRLGTAYNVSAYVSTGYEISPSFFKVFYTNPMPVETLTYNSSTDVTTTSFTVHWTINETSLYDDFTINISPEPENVAFPQTVSKDVLQYTFTNLSAGHVYLVAMVTRLAGKKSNPASAIFRTLPSKPQDVVLFNVSSSEVGVQWNTPSGSIDGYRLTLLLSGSEVKIVTQTDTKYTFLNLKPGTEYDVKVESQSGALFSEAVTQSVVTNPSTVPSLAITSMTSHSIIVTWEAPNDTNFVQYELRIFPMDANTPVRLDRQTLELTHTFSPLKAGQLYTVSVYTASGSNLLSERLADNAVTNPLPVEDLDAVPYGTGLNVSWSVNMSSQQSGFVISYQEWPSGPLTMLPILEAMANEYDYMTEIPDLFPGGNYMIKVQAWQNISGISSSSEMMEIIRTTEPKPVENLTAEIVDGDTIEVDWSSPTDSIHNYYLVRHRPSLRDSNAEWMVNSTLSTNFTLPDLFPGERYEIEVYVFSDTDVRSDVKIIHVVLDPLSPASVDVLTNQTTTTSVTLQWLYNRDATYVENWLVTYTDPAGDTVNSTVPSSSASIIEEVVGGLIAGYHYDMTVHAVVQEKMSTGTVIQATTKPLNNVQLTAASARNVSISVSYTIVENDFFDSILFSQPDTRQEIVRLKSYTPRELTFTGLEPGTVYSVSSQTVSGAEKSDRKSFTTNTAPNPPTLRSSVTAHDISLTIVHPVGSVDTYSVRCVADVTSSPVKVVNPVATKDDYVILIDMLQPYMPYTCSVKSIFRGVESAEVSVSVRTEQASSSEVRNLKAVESAPREIDLSWNMPEFQNGVIQVYMVTYTGTLGDLTEEGSRNITFPTSMVVFNDLNAGWTYTFSVRAYTTSVSEPAKITISLRTYKPSYKPGIDEETAKPKSEPASMGMTKAKVRFTNAFSHDLGEVIQYTVIVTEDKNSVDIRTKNTLPGWNTARNDPAIKAYQVIGNCSTFFDEGSTCDGKFGVRKRAVNEVAYKVFEIGSETGCENRYYCNGPLEPDTTYYVTLRAYTSMDYSDTPFSEAIRTAAIPVEEEGSNVGGIVGGVVSAVTAIIVVVVVVLVLRRRRNTKSTMYQHNPGQELAHRSSVGKKAYVPVHLSEFREHVLKLKADSDLGYAEQFEDLKDVGRGQACTAAELPCNRGKNRFTNILPYDHSRVKLLPIDDDEGSDYINANYVPGFHSKREYIVSQGPLPATRDDFWRLLWEQNVRNIVMLTKCVEKGREKCDHYWPNNSDAVFYGDLQVAILNETVFPDWSIIEFKVSLGDQSRQVRHFHFTSWPDFGVPKKEQVLVRFVRMVREKLQKDGGPIIVHCSAGVGRSGTFVVLDRLLQRMQLHDTVDVYNTVAELRRERVWMVQTEQQYVCIHNSLLCVVEGREDEHIYDNIGHANVAFEDDEGVDLN